MSPTHIEGRINMKKYYYVKDGKQIGPLSKEEIISEGISMNTLVWCEGMTSWVRASELEDFKGTNQVLPPPIPTEHNSESVDSISQTNEAESSTNSRKSVWQAIIAILCLSILVLIVWFYSSNKGTEITQDSINVQKQEKVIEQKQNAQRKAEREARVVQLQSEGGKLIGLMSICAERMNEAQEFNPFRTRKQKQQEMDALTKEWDEYSSRLITINAELVKLGEEPLIEPDKWLNI